MANVAQVLDGLIEEARLTAATPEERQRQRLAAMGITTTDGPSLRVGA